MAPTAQNPGNRALPSKCAACHPLPSQRSLAADRWPAYLKNHQRRLRLTESEKIFLYDFLVGGTLPVAEAR
jgi:hypothetical protein